MAGVTRNPAFSRREIGTHRQGTPPEHARTVDADPSERNPQPDLISCGPRNGLGVGSLERGEKVDIDSASDQCNLAQCSVYAFTTLAMRLGLFVAVANLKGGQLVHNEHQRRRTDLAIRHTSGNGKAPLHFVGRFIQQLARFIRAECEP